MKKLFIVLGMSLCFSPAAYSYNDPLYDGYSRFSISPNQCNSGLAPTYVPTCTYTPSLAPAYTVTFPPSYNTTYSNGMQSYTHPIGSYQSYSY